MQRKLNINGEILCYELEYKKVKNINLRITESGSIFVSANRYVPKNIIDEFVISKYNYIQRALTQMRFKEEAPLIQFFSEIELKKVITDICKAIYPYYNNLGISFPQIKFRKMISCWGNCRPKKGILTFNTNLKYAPPVCIEYVIYHEFTHFLHPNHSKEFYKELEKVFPSWKDCKSKLKTINIRQCNKKQHEI